MRLRLTLAYDGRPFEGWQSQPKGNTVQDHLEKAFAKIAGEAVRVHGSGRTDTGVHALAQTAHADVPEGNLPPETWMDALNGNLPPEIRVLRAVKTSAKFHARFSATGKVYRYRIWNEPWMHPMELGRAWHVTGPIDDALLRRALDALIGHHNFKAFCANRGGPPENTNRTVSAIKMQRRGSLVTLEVDGDGFLYKMVRLLTGSAVHVARGKAQMEWLTGLITAPSEIRSNRCAPADGLYLLKVHYRKASKNFRPTK